MFAALSKLAVALKFGEMSLSIFLSHLRNPIESTKLERLEEFVSSDSDFFSGSLFDAGGRQLLLVSDEDDESLSHVRKPLGSMRFDTLLLVFVLEEMSTDNTLDSELFGGSLFSVGGRLMLPVSEEDAESLSQARKPLESTRFNRLLLSLAL